jgi:hypothetical protein
MPVLARPRYVQAVRDDVCSVCVVFSPSVKNPRICDHEIDGNCPIFEKLDRAIEIVTEKDASLLSQRGLEVMKEICVGCRCADDKGVCHLMEARTRTSSWCILEAYFGLLLGAIEGVNRRIRSRPRI